MYHLLEIELQDLSTIDVPDDDNQKSEEPLKPDEDEVLDATASQSDSDDESTRSSQTKSSPKVSPVSSKVEVETEVPNIDAPTVASNLGLTVETQPLPMEKPKDTNKS